MGLNLVNVLDKQKLIFISTVSVYGFGKYLNEESKLNPLFCYGKTKLLAEEIVRGYSNSVIIRPSLVYGEEDLFLLKLMISDMVICSQKGCILVDYNTTFKRLK